MPALTTLPPELLNLILNYLAPTTSPGYQGVSIPLHFNNHPYSALNSLSRTCKFLHCLIKPLLFTQYIRRRSGDDIGLIYFVRALLFNPSLGSLIQSVQIDDSGCLSLPYSPPFAKPRLKDPWFVQLGNEPRKSRREGRENVPGVERGIDCQGRGTTFHRCKEAWGFFTCLTDEDWFDHGLMTEKEWEQLERKVYTICSSQSFQMGTGTDLQLSAIEWGRKQAAECMGMPYCWDEDPRQGIRGVESEEQGREAEKGHVTLRFGLMRIKRVVGGEGWGPYERWDYVEDEDEAYDGWRFDEGPPLPSRHTSHMLARRWLRALRRGSRDAWSALLLVLATGTRKIMATEVNWFARPDPHNCHDMLEGKQVKEIEARYEEEDEEWKAVGGYTWVGRVMWQCAADQSFGRAIQKLKQEKAKQLAENPPPKKRKRPTGDPHAFGEHHLNITLTENIRILPNIREIIIGSSGNPAHHPNFSLNTLLHFLQPPSVTHATIYGLSDATFGLHERKPPGIIQAKLGLRCLILENCNASADCLGFLASSAPDLMTLSHRGSLRRIYKPTIIPNLEPDGLVKYLTDYCPDLRALDLDPSNKYDQHALDAYRHGVRVSSFKGLEMLAGLTCRVEHLVARDEADVDGYISSTQSEKLEDEEKGLVEPLMLRDVLPRSLRMLVIGVDNEKYEKILEPLAVWVEGMETRMRNGKTKLDLVRLMCGSHELRERIRRDSRMARLARACNERGICPSLGLLG